MYEFHYKYIGKDIIIVLSCYLQTQIVWLMKLKQMILMKIFIKTRTCLILVTVQKIQNFLTLSIRKSLVE